MTETPSLDLELRRIAGHLDRLGVPFALVGGVAVALRGEVRLTRDVDVAIAVSSDEQTEALVRELRSVDYELLALVEHEERGRLATVRLRSPSAVKVDLIAASSGIEAEVVAGAAPVALDGIGDIPVATAVDLVALKVLSMTERRPQDMMDARGILLATPALDVARVRQRLELITSRGYHREQDLAAKLEGLLANLG